MATLVFQAIGTRIGGAIGGAIGALIGQQVDQAIIGTPSREGPRLAELPQTTSSYGIAIPRVHGRMRMGGAIIWADEIRETSEKESGGKGRPSTISYSYSASFAIAVSSRPIARVGRIWADGELLRGAAGDLKVAGVLRIHTGHGDQQPDPLLAAALGPHCPAHGGLAYVVFEDLQIDDFGRRVPALTFEVFGDDGEPSLAAMLDGAGRTVVDRPLPGLTGYAQGGGALSATLETLGEVFPLSAGFTDGVLSISAADDAHAAPAILDHAASIAEGEGFAPQSGIGASRITRASHQAAALRHYDPARDYLPGVQRGAGRRGSGSERVLELPAALPASTARALIEARSLREATRRERKSWRLAELDPQLMPGAVVGLPDADGRWRIEAWEWRDGGVELELERMPPPIASNANADSGRLPDAPDLPIPATVIDAFDAPPATRADAGLRSVYAAVGGTDEGWRGAALYADLAGVLDRLDQSASREAVRGLTTDVLPPSPAQVFEPAASLLVTLARDDMILASTSAEALLAGANRLLVGGEVVQFAQAERIVSGQWRLAGLLRGRGGTEAAAQVAKAAGEPVVLLDDRLVTLNGEALATTGTIAAIGLGDSEPAYGAIRNRGLGVRPLCPVHPVAVRDPGGLTLSWVPRVLGAWDWPDEVDVAPVEPVVQFRVGLGPVDAPLAHWDVAQTQLSIAQSTLDTLAQSHSGTALWVRQIGRFAQSNPLHLTHLA